MLVGISVLESLPPTSSVLRKVIHRHKKPANMSVPNVEVLMRSVNHPHVPYLFCSAEELREGV